MTNARIYPENEWSYRYACGKAERRHAVADALLEIMPTLGVAAQKAFINNSTLDLRFALGDYVAEMHLSSSSINDLWISMWTARNGAQYPEGFPGNLREGPAPRICVTAETFGRMRDALILRFAALYGLDAEDTP